MKLDKGDVHKSFKMWHKGSSKGSPLDDLALFNQLRNQEHSIRRATNQVLFDGLEALQTEHPKHTNFLRQRFIDGRSIQEMANEHNIGHTMAHKIQREALDHLTEVLSDMERQATAEREKELAKRLPPATYQNLQGAEEHLKQLKDAFICSELSFLASICGIGGIGKTSLADRLLRQIVRQGLFEGFGWVSAQQEVLNLGGGLKKINKPALTAETLVERLVEQLLDFTPAQLSGQQAFNALQGRLKEESHIIVIDNLETVRDVESLLPTLRRLANPSKFLLTSRKSLYAEPDIYHFEVPELSLENALQLIRQEATLRHLPHLLAASDDDLEPIYDTVGGNPLALRLVVGQTHIHHLSVVLNDLACARGESIENLYSYIYRQAWENLDEETRRLFLAMPLVIETGGVLSQMARVTRLEPPALRKSLYLLVTLNLVDVRHDLTESRYSIHNLTRTFLQEQVAKWL